MTSKKSTFTDEEVRRIQNAAAAVWQECGGDVLQATAEELNRSADRITMSRAEVMEIALDANRTEDMLKRHSRDPESRKATEDLIRRMNALSYEELKRLVRPAFPYARYGM
jgi:hypothetical protein